MRKKIKLNTDQRPFSIIYHDSIDSEVLETIHQLVLFITLKRFLNENNQCFPSLKKLAKVGRMSQRKVRITLRELEQKGLLDTKNRIKNDGSSSSNLYTLHDYAEIWNTENNKNIATVANKYEEMQLISELQSRGYTVIKKREPETLSADQSNNDSSSHDYNPSNKINTIPNSKESQELERYTMDEIHQLFDYNIMLIDYPDKQRDIDSVMDILYTAMNTTKKNIRIAGEDKPTMVVISKLMKLDMEAIIYTIEKFAKQTERINNPVPYMLTMLYNAPEQFNLDIQNLALHNMAHWSEKKKNIAN